MKTMTIVLFMAIFLCFCIYAEDDFVLSTITGLNMDDKTVQAKIDAYYKLKLDASVPTLLNGFVGFGAGSFAQNDTLFGIIGFCGDSAGIGLFVIGYMLPTMNVNDWQLTNVLITTGIGIIIASRFTQFLRVCTYTYDYNKNLWNSVIK